MNDSWKDFEPAPIEFFHGEIMKEFHKWREKTHGKENTTVPIDGVGMSNIIAKAKLATYSKYPKQNLGSAIPKSEM